MTRECAQLVSTSSASGSAPKPTVKFTLISKSSESTRPACIISSKARRSLAAASTSTMQRGSKRQPSMISPGSTEWPHCSFMLSITSPSSGTTSAHSGLSGSTS